MKNLLGLMLLLSQVSLAQNHFYGVLLDAHTQEKIPFGHFNYDANKGFISNDKGDFELFAEADTLNISISAIGYLNKSFLLKANTNTTVALTPKTENLAEVILDYVDPAEELIRKVVAAIPTNYPTEQEQVYGTYLEHAYWDSLQAKPIYKAETLTKADKFSYAKKASDGNVQILEHKLDVIDMDSVELRIYGGIHSAHSGDYVLGRHGPLKLSNLNDYDLKIKDTLEYDGRPIIQLNFSNKKSKGELYIDANSFALIRATRERHPNEIEENSNLFKAYKRIFWRGITSYEMGADAKWRLKFINYKTGFKRKNSNKKFYLNTTYFATQHLNETKLIPQKDRFLYSAILSDYLIQQQEDKTPLSKKQRFISFLVKLRYSYNIGVNPFQVNSHQFHHPALPSEINFNETNLNVWVYDSKIEYPLANQWGISWRNSFSIKHKLYRSDLIALDYHQDLSKRNRVYLNSSLGIGYRKLRASHGTIPFKDPFKLKSRTFDSEKFSLYTENRELFIQPSLGIDFRLKGFLRLGLEAAYFIPLKNSNGLYSYEEDEFWFWNRAKTFQKNTIETAGSSIIKNQFATRLTLTIKY